jgi:hypothetical protein
MKKKKIKMFSHPYTDGGSWTEINTTGYLVFLSCWAHIYCLGAREIQNTSRISCVKNYLSRAYHLKGFPDPTIHQGREKGGGGQQRGPTQCTHCNCQKGCQIHGRYTERIDLWFEPFYVKEKRRVLNDCKRLKLLINEEQHCYIFSRIQQNKFFRLIVN